MVASDNWGVQGQWHDVVTFVNDWDVTFGVVEVQTTSTPEPVSMALLGLTALGGIGLRLRRNRKAQAAA